MTAARQAKALTTQDLLRMLDHLLSQQSRQGCKDHGADEQFLATDYALEIHSTLCEWIRSHAGQGKP